MYVLVDVNQSGDLDSHLVFISPGNAKELLRLSIMAALGLTS